MDDVESFHQSAEVYSSCNHNGDVEQLVAGTPYVKPITCPSLRNPDEDQHYLVKLWTEGDLPLPRM